MGGYSGRRYRLAVACTSTACLLTAAVWQIPPVVRALDSALDPTADWITDWSPDLSAKPSAVAESGSLVLVAEPTRIRRFDGTTGAELLSVTAPNAVTFADVVGDGMGGGYVVGTISLTPLSGAEPDPDVWFARIDDVGRIVWERSFGNPYDAPEPPAYPTGIDVGQAITVDDDGRLHIAGVLDATAGSPVGRAFIHEYAVSGSDATLVWEGTYLEGRWPVVRDVASGPSGVYIVGDATGPLSTSFVVGADRTDGTEVAAREDVVPNGRRSVANAVAVGPLGVYVAGSSTLFAGDDAHLVKLNAVSLETVWSEQVGEQESGYDPATDTFDFGTIDAAADLAVDGAEVTIVGTSDDPSITSPVAGLEGVGGFLRQYIDAGGAAEIGTNAAVPPLYGVAVASDSTVYVTGAFASAAPEPETCNFGSSPNQRCFLARIVDGDVPAGPPLPPVVDGYLTRLDRDGDPSVVWGWTVPFSGRTPVSVERYPFSVAVAVGDAVLVYGDPSEVCGDSGPCPPGGKPPPEPPSTLPLPDGVVAHDVVAGDGWVAVTGGRGASYWVGVIADETLIFEDSFSEREAGFAVLGDAHAASTGDGFVVAATAGATGPATTVRSYVNDSDVDCAADAVECFPGSSWARTWSATLADTSVVDVTVPFHGDPVLLSQVADGSVLHRLAESDGAVLATAGIGDGPDGPVDPTALLTDGLVTLVVGTVSAADVDVFAASVGGDLGVGGHTRLVLPGTDETVTAAAGGPCHVFVTGDTTGSVGVHTPGFPAGDQRGFVAGIGGFGSCVTGPGGDPELFDDFVFAAPAGLTGIHVDGSVGQEQVHVVGVGVAPSNTGPIADDQTVTTDEDTAVGIVLSGTDPDGDPLAYTVVDEPAHGTLTGGAPDLIYTPDQGFFGNDSFTFTVTDGHATSPPATVTISTQSTNRTPIADDQTVTTDEDTAVGIVLSGTDPDGDPLAYTVVDQPAHGTLTGAAPHLTYTPDQGFFGNDSFTFTVTDGEATSQPAAVTIRVVSNGANIAPIADPQTVSTTTATPVSILLTGTDPDVGPTPLTYSVTDAPDHGTLTGTAPDLIYTPDTAFAGLDMFSFTVSDGTDTSPPATVSLIVTGSDGNQPPVAYDRLEGWSTDQTTPLTIALAANDPERDALIYRIIEPPAGGRIEVSDSDQSGEGRVLDYIPDIGHRADIGGSYTDTFTYIANDGELDSNVATFQIQVEGRSYFAGQLTASTSLQQGDDDFSSTRWSFVADPTTPEGSHLPWTTSVPGSLSITHYEYTARHLGDCLEYRIEEAPVDEDNAVGAALNFQEEPGLGERMHQPYFNPRDGGPHPLDVRIRVTEQICSDTGSGWEPLPIAQTVITRRFTNPPEAPPADDSPGFSLTDSGVYRVDERRESSETGFALIDSVQAELARVPCNTSGDTDLDGAADCDELASGTNPYGDGPDPVYEPGGTVERTGFDDTQPIWLHLGDSYQSGEGAYDYDPATDSEGVNHCHRSWSSYPFIADQNLAVDHGIDHAVVSVACSGATIANVLGVPFCGTGCVEEPWMHLAQGEPAQLDVLRGLVATGMAPNIVTLGIGGNDAGFADVLKQCIGSEVIDWLQEWWDANTTIPPVLPPIPPLPIQNFNCVARFDPAVGGKLPGADTPELVNRVGNIVSQVKSIVPADTRVIVVGYPVFMHLPADNCPIGIGENEAEWIRGQILQMNRALEFVVTGRGGTYLSLDDVYGDDVHCNPGNEPLLHDLNFGVPGDPCLGMPCNESFHPKAQGHQRTADALAACILDADSCGSASAETVRPPSELVDGTIEVCIVDPVRCISDLSLPLGVDLVVSGDGFLPNTVVEVALFSDPVLLGTATTDASGAFETTITIPDDGSVTPGDHVLAVVGPGDDTLIRFNRAEVTVSEQHALTSLLVSTRTPGRSGAVRYRPSDIIQVEADTGDAAIFFDGSDVGLNRNLNGFEVLADGTVLLTWSTPFWHPSLGWVDDSDIVLFTPTSTGHDTAGTFELLLDGSDVGLTTPGEDIDAIAVDTSGNLVISTAGSASAGGVQVSGNDLLALNASSWGDDTSGTWARVFDGQVHGLSRHAERIDAAAIDLAGRAMISTAGRFEVAGFTGTGNHVLSCPDALRRPDPCPFELLFDGGRLSGVDGIGLSATSPLLHSAEVGTAETRNGRRKPSVLLRT